MRYPVNYIAVAQGLHQGKCIDFGWSAENGGKNQPVYAVANGVVYLIEKQDKGGNVIYIKHDDGLCSCYAHLNTMLVVKNQVVKLGEKIGTMGGTGITSGNNLHFGLYTSVENRYKDASSLDPFEYLEVYENQTVGAITASEYKSKIIYRKNNISKYVYNVDYEGLVVRESVGGKATGELLQVGTKVEELEVRGNYSKIDTNKWVYNRYLTSEYPNSKSVTAEDGLRVRKGPGASYNMITVLPYGNKVQVYETKNGWSKVSPTAQAWVSSNYIK